jgi:hypothetical protein
MCVEAARSQQRRNHQRHEVTGLVFQTIQHHRRSG